MLPPAVRIIKPAFLVDAARRHPNSGPSLRAWQTKSATRRPLPPAFADLPKDYRVLCAQILLPRPLRTRAEYREALAVAEAMAGHDLTRDQSDYLDAIGTFLGEWEEAHEKRLPAVAPHELLAFLLAENSLCGSDLARILGVTRSLASRLLAGQRQLTAAHISVLSARFKLHPGAFLPDFTKR